MKIQFKTIYGDEIDNINNCGTIIDGNQFNTLV